jgi:Domain of unknown function (DUF4249)
MRKSFSIYFYLLACTIALLSCEEVIDLELESAEPILVVDAWVNNKPEPQVIKLSRTQPYFATVLPPSLSGATVVVEDSDNNTYIFVESITEPGTYVWTPVGPEVLGAVDRTFTLTVTTNGEVFEALSDMGRVPVVDSITFFEEEATQFADVQYQAEFWATDPVGSGDAYWIKTYKNGQFLNKPADINVAYDAGFSRGGSFGGIAFISPIRTAINPFDEDENEEILSPYVVGDSVYVEITSLSEAAFDFLNEVIIQTDRPGGFAELFAAPLANVSTNIKNTNPNGTKAVGFFNVSAVEGLGRKFNSLDDLMDR